MPKSGIGHFYKNQNQYFLVLLKAGKIRKSKNSVFIFYQEFHMSFRQIFSRIVFITSISLGYITPSLGMDVPLNVNNSNNDSSNSQSATQRPFRTYAEQQSFQSAKQKKYPFGFLNAGYDERLFKESLSNAPTDIHDIIDDLLDPTENNDETREIALLGPTGSGKSTLAKAMVAIGLKRDYLFVPATSLLNHYKHKTCENIYLLFESLMESKPRPELILDEVNVLGDSHLQDQSDGADIANTLWTCTDIYNKETGSLVIATTNNLKRMPTQLQQRFNGNIIEIPYRPISIKDLRFAMEKHIKYSLAKECENNGFLETLMRQTQILSTAEINKMIKLAVRMARKNKITLNNKTIVTANDINSACAKILYSREHLCDFREQVAPEERRHRETLAQNRELSDRTHNLSLDQHTSTLQQNAEHHADSQALSSRQFAATQLQNDDHFIASQGLSREQQASSQQLSVDLQNASQQLSVDLHNNTQQQNADQHAASQQLSVDLHNNSQQLTIDIHNDNQTFQLRQGVYQAWLHDKDVALAASNATLPFFGLAAAGLARLATGSKIDAYLAIVNPPQRAPINQQNRNVNHVNPRNLDQHN